MVIYGRPNFQFGKDVPAMGPFKNYRPNIVGPHSSKIKVGIYIGTQLGKFLWSRPWVKGTLSGIAISSGVNLIGPKNGSPVGNYKAHAKYRKRGNSKQYNKKYRTGRRQVAKRCHCCC